MKIAETNSGTQESKLDLENPSSDFTALNQLADGLSSFFISFFSSLGNIIVQVFQFFSDQLLFLAKPVKKVFSVLIAKSILLTNLVKQLGVAGLPNDAFKRRIGLLNQINLLHFLSNIIIPGVVFATNSNISVVSFLLSLTPSLISILVLYLNAQQKFNAALLVYFILFPFFTSLIYLGGMNLGMELYFIMFGILAVFFLNQTSYIVFTVSFSMISYFVLTVLLKDYSIKLQSANPLFYIFNQFVAIVFIFYGLLLIKKENAEYQEHILSQNKEITDKAVQLEQQAGQLTALNSVKTRLFSIISHDLKAPVYALRDIFRNVEENRLPLDEFNKLIPDVVKDLDKTTSLMESVLQWAKNQFRAESLQKEYLNIKEMVNDTINPLLLQLENKAITLRTMVGADLTGFADKDTISIVLRNLLSNAIKFTPPGGTILVDARNTDKMILISVHDTGVGIPQENIQKILKGEHYSTEGTQNEKGTGLGLMLCQDFIIKNGGTLTVDSEPGKGSSFCFSIPLYK